MMAKQLNVNHRTLQPLIQQTVIAHSAYAQDQLQRLVQARLCIVTVTVGTDSRPMHT